MVRLCDFFELMSAACPNRLVNRQPMPSDAGRDMVHTRHRGNENSTLQHDLDLESTSDWQ